MEQVNPAADRDVVLALNSGSSSLKFGLYDVGPTGVVELTTGAVEAMHFQDRMFERIEAALTEAKVPGPTAIGHRIVHGGPTLRRHSRIEDDVVAQLKEAVALAPLHGPASLALIRLAEAHYPALPQVACFDTVFHTTLPEIAYVLPIPRAMSSDGVRRYGFHGLSCASIVRQLGGELPDRLIIAHLGNGASVTAVKAGRSIDTSMGLTPTGGVVMGSRTGDLDPGVLLYLLREKGLDGSALEALVDNQSGLLGISGVSGDMRALHLAATEHPDASLAIDIFCYSVRKQIGAMAAVLGGVDMLVFTGGIGENDAAVRRSILGDPGWVGNFAVRVINAREDEQIARETHIVLADTGRL
ncbi:acetate/propionate family kinase [Sphingomonas sp. PAMC 26617]|uniref:acetate/propionate family kinase n=1 Tax=Sphingomonas sp. PAMC 26617 TaxID=1112216 RepID=UPI0002883023|nr:acetate kinase [Sphingomonas sp. PAMC 26617]